MTETRARSCRGIRRGDPDYPPLLGRSLAAHAPDELYAFGRIDLATRPALAIFSSIRTPPDLILRTIDLARALRGRGVTTVGGFQSPLEKECLALLLRGTQPIVACPARGLEGMRVPMSWRGPLRDGRMLVLSPFGPRQRRPALGAAALRNRIVAALAERIFVIHARPGSRTFHTAAAALARGTEVLCFDHPRNRDLILLGSTPADARTLAASPG